MAENLTVKVTGSPEQRGIRADTVGDARTKVSAGDRNASVNGSPADDGQSLQNGDFVAFASNVKGNN